MERTQEQIDEQINKAMEAEDRGSSAWPGMSYEQGVRAALDWVIGFSDAAPMEDE